MNQIFTHFYEHKTTYYVISFNLQINNMAEIIIGRYSDNDEFTNLMTTIGMARPEIERLNREGFNTLEDLVSTYTDTKELEKLITNLNKTFGTHPTIPCYFPVAITRRLMGIHYRFHLAANVMNKVINLVEITPVIANTFAEEYVAWTSKKEKYEDLDIETPTFNQDNWLHWKEKFTNYCECCVGTRNIPIDYILNRIDVVPNDMSIATINTPFSHEFISSNATHIGEKFNSDSSLVFTLLENDLRDTPGWNHISSFKRNRDGRSAWKSLLNHYEGKQFQTIIRTKSFNTLKNTYYRGEHTSFSFKKYTNKHMSAHKELQDIGHPTPTGLDERTKIQYFVDGIKPSAHLEMALSVASQDPLYESNFIAMVNYLGSEVERTKARSLSNKDNSRRNVNAVRGGRGGRGRGRGRGRGKNRATTSTGTEGKYVDGKWITDKYYPNFKELTQAQKDAIRDLKRQKVNSDDASQVSDVTVQSDLRTIKTFITKLDDHISPKSSNNESSDTQDESQVSSDTRKANAGSAGASLMNRKRNQDRA